MQTLIRFFRIKTLFVCGLILGHSTGYAGSDWRLFTLSSDNARTGELRCVYGDIRSIEKRAHIVRVWLKDAKLNDVKLVVEKYRNKYQTDLNLLTDSGYVPFAITSFNSINFTSTIEKRAVIELLISCEIAMSTGEVEIQKTGLYEFNQSTNQFRILTVIEPGKEPAIYPNGQAIPWYYIAPDTAIENVFDALSYWLKLRYPPVKP